jgi:hypothetical protein
MKFLLTFTFKSEIKGRDEAITRFKQTGGAPPPRGVKLLGRWTAADMSGGYDLLDADDPKLLADLCLTWCDLTDLKIVPVLDDTELTEVFKAAGKL